MCVFACLENKRDYTLYFIYIYTLNCIIRTVFKYFIITLDTIKSVGTVFLYPLLGL